MNQVYRKVAEPPLERARGQVRSQLSREVSNEVMNRISGLPVAQVWWQILGQVREEFKGETDETGL